MVNAVSLQVLVSNDRTVSAEVVIPDDAKALLVLAHGAGANMKHEFFERLANELVKRGIGTFRFNFLYMEQGRRMPDPPAVAIKTVKAVIQTAHELYPTLQLIAGGKSFGGRMSSQYVASESPAHLKALIFYGFPLHPADQPSVERAKHLKDVQIPMLFLQGTKDKLAYLNLIEQVCKDLPLSTLQLFEKADHSFKKGKTDFIPDLAIKTSEWLNHILH